MDSAAGARRVADPVPQEQSGERSQHDKNSTRAAAATPLRWIPAQSGMKNR